MTDQSSPEQSPAPSEMEQLRDSVHALQTIVNRVREAVAADAPATTTPAADESAQTLRWLRRESLLVLLARLDRHQLHGDEIALLRQHVETEMREADTARAVARANLRHVQTIVPEIDRLAVELEDAGQRATGFLAERGRAQAALDRVRDVARDWGPTLLPRSEAHCLLTDLRKALDGPAAPAAPAATEATDQP